MTPGVVSVICGIVKRFLIGVGGKGWFCFGIVSMSAVSSSNRSVLYFFALAPCWINRLLVTVLWVFHTTFGSDTDSELIEKNSRCCLREVE